MKPKGISQGINFMMKNKIGLTNPKRKSQTDIKKNSNQIINNQKNNNKSLPPINSKSLNKQNEIKITKAPNKKLAQKAISQINNNNNIHIIKITPKKQTPKTKEKEPKDNIIYINSINSFRLPEGICDYSYDNASKYK